MILKYRKEKLKFRDIKLNAQGYRGGTQILIYMLQNLRSLPLPVLLYHFPPPGRWKTMFFNKDCNYSETVFSP